MPNPNEPFLDILIHNNATVTMYGKTIDYYIDSKTHIELLISVGNRIGNPYFTYNLNIIEPASGKIISSYEAFCDKSNQTNSIVLNELDVTGTYINISWDGRIDSNNYFTNVYSRFIVKG